ncbi:hypothetical protein [Sphingopyxis sp.]|uniref:hypothetical protein n=1 Tax=Sphingopyxis sp. TaxID=1908224 RepID=UPI003D0A1D50
MKFAPAASIAAALLLALSCGAAHAKDQIADPFDRADASFSRYPLNLPSTPQAIGRLTNGDVCDDDNGFSCEWQDDAGVVHIFSGDILAIKAVDVGAATPSLSALGIGTARTRNDVLTKVRAFLPEIKIDCLEPGQAGEGEGVASCGGSFENGGWIKLLFDANNRLKSARIDAFQMN